MGLDITAYKNLKIVENPQFDEDGLLEDFDTQWHPGASMEWSEEYFPGRGEGIDPQLVYEWEDEYCFRAGSYTGFYKWRETLETFVEGNDFQELIDFPDNEGVIGPIVAKKLYNDFERNLEKAKDYAVTLKEYGEWWLERYKDWLIACLFASENGAIDFH